MAESKGHDPSSSHRRSMRLDGYDYSLAGAYFVTTVAMQRECLFGDLTNGEMRLNKFGQIVSQSWEWLSEQYMYVELDSFIMMLTIFMKYYGLMNWILNVGAGRDPPLLKLSLSGN
jgi:hypothetical protein